MNKRVAFITLGCKLNFAETSTYARQVSAEGWEEARPGADTDLVVINTCSVTEHADKKCPFIHDGKPIHGRPNHRYGNNRHVECHPE